MDVARILTNETCNQRCAFCHQRRPVERAAVVRADLVRGRIDAALAAGARELVLTGGEPTLRRDLPALVAHARRGGAQRVVLETNAALLDDARARALAAAGLGQARVHLPLWGAGADGLSRDDGGFGRTVEGLRALARAGVPLEVSTPVVRANLARLAELPAALAASGLPVRAVLVGVPVSAPDDGALAPLGEAAAAIDALEAAARPVGLGVRLEPNAPIPPCLFPQPARVAHLFSLTPGSAARPGHAKVAACAGCAVRDRCPGLPDAALAREPGLAPRPIADDRARRRLSLASPVEEQIARELVTRDARRRPGGAVVPEHIVRVNFHCNQACRFCFVATHLPPAQEAAVEAALAELGALGGLLTLSGGEPTLNPRLVEYVRLGKRLGARAVELQTNAIRLADPALTAALVEAGVDGFLVSLHASTAERSDAITGAPGTFEKTALGLDALAKTDRELTLNFVVCEQNAADFPAYVSLVAARWPRARITVSFVAASTDLVPRERSLIPRMSDVLPALAEGLRRGRQLGVAVGGFEGRCGVPLCLVPKDVAEYFDLAELADGADRGAFVKPEPCGACALSRRCYGLRRTYVELHGAAEVRPVPPGPGA